jgi:hypothetical protein
MFLLSIRPIAAGLDPCQFTLLVRCRAGFSPVRGRRGRVMSFRLRRSRRHTRVLSAAGMFWGIGLGICQEHAWQQ